MKFPTSPLAEWYSKYQRRLPWRENPTPYKTWVSEIMLQQTQVQNVIPYFNRFVERFPTLNSLAAASEPDVLALWSGLGYYSRAKNLLKAAQIMRDRYKGRLPDRLEELKTLPGVGDYTAGAILSIAYNRPVPILDGNIVRVLGRFALEDDERNLWKISAQIVGKAFAEGVPPSNFNQALMELGALVCSPQNPLCLVCPLGGECLARARNMQSSFPPARKRAKTVVKKLAMVLFEKNAVSKDGEKRSRFLVMLRSGRKQWLQGLWELPTVEQDPGPAGGGKNSLKKLSLDVGRLVRARAAVTEKVGAFRHSITHHRIDVQLFRGVLRSPRKEGRTFRWISKEELGSLSSSSMLSKALRLAGGKNLTDPASKC